jgi:hypothetical protein
LPCGSAGVCREPALEQPPEPRPAADTRPLRPASAIRLHSARAPPRGATRERRPPRKSRAPPPPPGATDVVAARARRGARPPRPHRARRGRGGAAGRLPPPPRSAVARRGAGAAPGPPPPNGPQAGQHAVGEDGGLGRALARGGSRQGGRAPPADCWRRRERWRRRARRNGDPLPGRHRSPRTGVGIAAHLLPAAAAERGLRVPHALRAQRHRGRR